MKQLLVALLLGLAACSATEITPEGCDARGPI